MGRVEYEQGRKTTLTTALADTLTGLYRTETIHRREPWRHLQHFEFAAPEWVDWFNTRRRLESIGNIPPVEFEQRHNQDQQPPAMVAGLT